MILNRTLIRIRWKKPEIGVDARTRLLIDEQEQRKERNKRESDKHEMVQLKHDEERLRHNVR